MKLLKENVRGKLLDMSLGSALLDLIPNGKATKAKIYMWDSITLLYHTKKLCSAKEIINKMKRQPIEWEKIFTNFVI